MWHFNELTPAEDERLALLLEECGEVIQVIGKIQRHGYLSHDPTSQAQYPPNNRDLLAKELGDVLAAITMMEAGRDIVSSEILTRRDVKLKKVRKYLHHQPEPK
jgi:NTP pyrophosphatase (non-canonical NTP hydrolase)